MFYLETHTNHEDEKKVQIKSGLGCLRESSITPFFGSDCLEVSFNWVTWFIGFSSAPVLNVLPNDCGTDTRFILLFRQFFAAIRLVPNHAYT
jgi:hypothetical protein